MAAHKIEIQLSAISNIWIHSTLFFLKLTFYLLLYVIILHLVLIFQEYPDYVAYTTPLFFVDDWLNMYLDSHPMHRDSDIANHKNEVNCADYRFVYIGAKGNFYFFKSCSILCFTELGFCASVSYPMLQVNVSSLIIITVIWCLGTWTPLHADVFRSYSWSANVCGRKLWLFLAPSQSHLIFDR